MPICQRWWRMLPRITVLQCMVAVATVGASRYSSMRKAVDVQQILIRGIRYGRRHTLPDRSKTY
jgi:negative regulator of sigma E activity